MEDMDINLTPKQLRILTLIRDYRLAYGYSPTMQELAEEVGVSKVTVFEHCEALIKKGALVRDANKARSLQVAHDVDLPDERDTRVPLVGAIAAGYPIEAVEDRQFVDLEDLFGPHKRRGRKKTSETFALEVTGDSMIEELIREGDYVICERRSNPRNGDTVVALLADEEATLKKFYKEKGGRIRLQPANRKYDPIIVKEREIEIQGIVIGVVRVY